MFGSVRDLPGIVFGNACTKIIGDPDVKVVTNGALKNIDLARLRSFGTTARQPSLASPEKFVRLAEP